MGSIASRFRMTKSRLLKTFHYPCLAAGDVVVNVEVVREFAHPICILTFSKSSSWSPSDSAAAAPSSRPYWYSVELLSAPVVLTAMTIKMARTATASTAMIPDGRPATDLPSDAAFSSAGGGGGGMTRPASEWTELALLAERQGLDIVETECCSARRAERSILKGGVTVGAIHPV